MFRPAEPYILTSKVQVLLDLRPSQHEPQLAAKPAAQQQLHQADAARQSAILQSLPIVLHVRSAEPPFHTDFLSGAVKQITGFEPADFLARPDLAASRIHPDDIAMVAGNLLGVSTTGGYACEFRWRCADGCYRVFQDQGVLSPERDGERRQIFGSIVDVTDSRGKEDACSQARKMEAVGRLTGGVAHDFNNLLTVILGNADMLLERRENDEKRAVRAEAIRESAERGRSLTRQLLAFAKRQRLEPAVIDVGQLIHDFAPLLHQAVGEAVTVKLDIEGAPLFANVDAIQLETALLNLAVNARDAMLHGGALSVALRDVEDGVRWVEIEVADTGEGMCEETKAMVFEPFFTTKGVGAGSGLGLSQVYGFVSQSGGEVRLWSEPGQGARFHLRLPASSAPTLAPPQPRSDPLSVIGSERVLVVEDDPSVLCVTVEALEAQGYQVLTAMHAAQAMAQLEADPDIELLFSDVVMPGGVSGIGLARQAHELRPDLRILLTSGFVGETALTAEFPMIDKPYECGALAAALRRVLDGPSPGASKRVQSKAATRA